MSRTRRTLPWPKALRYGTNLCYCYMCSGVRSPRVGGIKGARKKVAVRDMRDQMRGAA